MVLAKSIVAFAILLISPLDASNRYRHDSSDVVIRGSDLKYILRNLQNSELAGTLTPEERKTAEYEIIIDASKKEDTKNKLDNNENRVDKMTSNDLKPKDPEEVITIVSAQAFEKPAPQGSAYADKKDDIALEPVSDINNDESKPWATVEEKLSLKSLKYKKVSQLNK